MFSILIRAARAVRSALRGESQSLSTGTRSSAASAAPPAGHDPRGDERPTAQDCGVSRPQALPVPTSDDPDRDPTTVLLPTRTWGPVCRGLAAALAPDDELLVLCDAPTDPVADHDPPAGVEVLVAGEPEGCSGKANALALGMERASNDRVCCVQPLYLAHRTDNWLVPTAVLDTERVRSRDVPRYVTTQRTIPAGITRLWQGSVGATKMCPSKLADSTRREFGFVYNRGAEYQNAPAWARLSGLIPLPPQPRVCRPTSFRSGSTTTG